LVSPNFFGQAGESREINGRIDIDQLENNKELNSDLRERESTRRAGSLRLPLKGDGTQLRQAATQVHGWKA